MLIDLSLGEIYGPSVMGEDEPPTTPTPWGFNRILG
jgi:hypothetical protein